MGNVVVGRATTPPSVPHGEYYEWISDSTGIKTWTVPDGVYIVYAGIGLYDRYHVVVPPDSTDIFLDSVASIYKVNPGDTIYYGNLYSDSIVNSNDFKAGIVMDTQSLSRDEDGKIILNDYKQIYTWYDSTSDEFGAQTFLNSSSSTVRRPILTLFGKTPSYFGTPPSDAYGVVYICW